MEELRQRLEASSARLVPSTTSSQTASHVSLRPKATSSKLHAFRYPFCFFDDSFMVGF
jgi:hypothetical protein